MQNKSIEEKFIYSPVPKDKDAIPLWFCFPSTYMIGMSSLGYLALFRIFDQNKGIYPERIFTDTENTIHNPKEIELAGFSFSFELDFLGVFKILSKYNIPFRAKDRTNDHPIIFGGGPVLTANPEPYADFFDVINLGDGEEVLTELVNAYKEVRYLQNRREKLEHLAKIRGVYVPSLYNVEYNSDDTIKSYTRNNPKTPEILTKRCIETLTDCVYTPILTKKTMFSDMFLIETSRGCPRRCAFCLASYLNLPSRYPDFKSIINSIDIGLNNTHKIGLLGALITEHPEFDRICEHILFKRKEKKFELSVSSLRADKITPLMIKTLVEGGQKNTTIAIEAGSERLRKVINKNLSEEEIRSSIKIARENGLSGLKIYGMIGLPTETQEDIAELVNLMNKLKKENKGFKLTLSISSFVPKAHTPFQWEVREDTKDIEKKNDFLKKELHKLGIEFKPTSVKWDYVQAVLSRGDRRLSPLLEKVYEYNGSLGSWGRSYKEFKDGQECPSYDWYALRKRDYNEILPWDFIDVGIDKQILIKEHQKVIN
ncbi:MAG: radical SAM protein [Candidatus Gastranaerophilales bacterium]|nr:radical SAM protein [Candidatus Gastranaerophilales bacterium]